MSPPLPVVSVWVPWGITLILGAGMLLTSDIRGQEAPELRRSLEATIPDRLLGHVGRDVEISEAEQAVAGFTDHLMRVYGSEDGPEVGGEAKAAFSLYVGFYESQARGTTIHSPRNCMPGAGWESLSSRTALIPLPGGGDAEVNRYILTSEEEQVLVLYWYQGRGRVVANEYRAKWDLLRDAAVHQRSDEALVRIVVPIVESEEKSFEVARAVAAFLIPTLFEALPEWSA